MYPSKLSMQTKIMIVKKYCTHQVSGFWTLRHMLVSNNILPEDEFLISRTVTISTTTKECIIIGRVILRLTILNVHLTIENAEIQWDFHWHTRNENLLIIIILP